MDFEKKNGDTSIAATKTIKSILSKREKVAKDSSRPIKYWLEMSFKINFPER